MSRLLLCSLALVALLAGCSRKENKAEVRWRFLGGRVLQTQTNAPALKEVLNLPEITALSTPLANQLIRSWWSLGKATGEPSAAALADGRNLVQDLIQQLSIGEVFIGEGGRREFALAIQVPANRTSLWEHSWPAWIQALNSARGVAAGTAKPAVVRKDVWLVAVSDTSVLSADDAMRHLAAYPPETGALLQFETALPEVPPTKVSFVTTNGNVRVMATAQTPKTLPSSLPDWDLPGFIREPMIQFTAARGIDALTAGWIKPEDAPGGSWPNQLFIWGQPNINMRFPFAVAQVDNPQAHLDHLFKKYQPFFAPAATQPRYMGQLLRETNLLTIAGGVPGAPTLQAEQEKKPLLTFGVVPLIRTTNPPSAGMIAQMSKPNVMYYDFEFTSEAISQWNAFLQLGDLLEGRTGIMTYPGTQWLLAARPKLGECVTVITKEGDQKLQLIRKSPIGLSGLELTALSRWLDPKPPLRRMMTNSPVRPKK